MKMIRNCFSIICILCMTTLFTPHVLYGEQSVTVTIGSKKFTESVILGEIVSHLTEDIELKPVHRREWAGPWRAGAQMREL